jgi:hypothetical protein
MDTNRHNRGAPGYAPYANGNPNGLEKNYVEHTIDQTSPSGDKPNSSGSFGRTPTVQDDNRLTDAEVNLLRKLRTMNGADYEAQYFDTKHSPNRKTLIEKMGNPTPL